MKLLFCYDGPLRKDDCGNYYGIALNNELMSRYECIADKINIAIRVRGLENKSISNMSKIDSKKFQIIEVPNLSSINGTILNRIKAKKILKKEILNSDLIIIRLPSIIGNLAADICRRLKKKYLIEMVGCPWDALWNYNIKGKMMAPIEFMRTKYELIKADYVVYVSNKFLQRRYPSTASQICCSNVVLNQIDNDIILKRQKKIKNMQEKKLVIGTLGAIDVHFKGQQYVISALAKLRNIGYDIEYQIVGSGDPAYLRSVAKKFNVENMVKIIGTIKHEKVFEWIDSLDIYIQPSNQEGLCRSIIEAMSRGCPVIASNAGGNAELINNEYIFKKKRINQIVDRIVKMTKDNMLVECKNNFNNSKMYDANILKDRRDKFLQKYRDSVKR